MGKEYVILSMLKEKKIDYHFLAKEKKVRLPCPNCSKEITLCTVTTNWKCPYCNNHGNLLAFLRNNFINVRSTIYNPMREKKQILNSLTRLVKKEKQNSNSNETLLNLKTKLEKLLKYYEKEIENLREKGQ